MRAKHLVPVFKELLPSFPGFVFHKTTFFQSPIGSLLRAVDLETSGWDKNGFNVTVFVMPMCVPKDYLVFTHGDRVNDPRCVWSMTMPDLVPRLREAIQMQALPFLERCQTLADFAELAATNPNPHAPKNRAYAHARAGRDRDAIGVIDAFLPAFVPNVAWQQQIVDDLMALRALLVGDPDATHRRLEQWEGETIDKLGLGRYR